MYRSSDSYIIGTADYNRWLNCELNNEFLSAEIGNNNLISTSFLPLLVEGGGGSITNQTNQTNSAATDSTAKTDMILNQITTNDINELNATDKIKQLAKKNPIIALAAVFGITYLVFK